MASDSRTAMWIPISRKCSVSAAVMEDFPEAGKPVIQTAKPDALSGRTVLIHFGRLKHSGIQYGGHEIEEFVTHGFAEMRVPDRMRHDQPAKYQKGRCDFKHFGIAGFIQVAFPETGKQIVEDAFEKLRTLK